MSRIFVVHGSGHIDDIATDPAGKLNVLAHHSDPLGMNGNEVSVLKQTNDENLGRLMECTDGLVCDPVIRCGVRELNHLMDHATHGGTGDDAVGGLLILADLLQGQGARANQGLQWMLADFAALGGRGKGLLGSS